MLSAVAGPRAWNNLPVDLRLSRAFIIFKTHLKSRLFNLSFPSVWLYYWLHHWLFLYRALEDACAAYASLNLSLLHYILLLHLLLNCAFFLNGSKLSISSLTQSTRSSGVQFVQFQHHTMLDPVGIIFVFNVSNHLSLHFWSSYWLISIPTVLLSSLLVFLSFSFTTYISLLIIQFSVQFNFTFCGPCLAAPHTSNIYLAFQF